ncbi:MAG: bifunctional riboflavin kinase/FAD synthetase [Betaproteobacteria bacterium]|nr:bifunctional riboflavin kinase/FAD synthetase [Betaproteobacteria bacterium]
MLIRRSIPAVADTPVVLTIGNFDGVHLGHQAMLARLTEAARELGVPSCVLTFEPHPREFFAPDQAPTRLTSLREKLELLERAGVERVQICRFNFDFAKTTAEDFIDRILRRSLGARWILVGDDFRFGARRAGDIVMLRQSQQRCGFDVHVMISVVADGQRVSSTAVRDALAAGDMTQARRLLGRPYSISGRVVGGDRIGRKLGCPTANVQMKHNRPPLSGIFAVEVHGVDGRVLPGVASLGVRPTLARDARPCLEVHLLDFERDIYGAHLKVDFLHKFRDEEKYADVETLKRQIAADVENARNYFLAAKAQRKNLNATADKRR